MDSAEEAQRIGFVGSSTVLVDGLDPFASRDEPGGLACRIYDTDAGPQDAPTVEELRAALT